MNNLKVTILTNEYPPHIYGGAGVHVEFLSKALARLIPVEVRSFSRQESHTGNLDVYGYAGWTYLEGDQGLKHLKVLQAMAIDLAMMKTPILQGVVHAHTWYTCWAGFLAKQLFDRPLVITVHSLEPLRPWKEEQLGNAYRISTWLEKTGLTSADKIIAVSRGMKDDILSRYPVDPEKVAIIHNGIDLHDYQAAASREALRPLGLSGDDYILFVGRLSRQKGIMDLLKAINLLPPGVKTVLCAGTPDTPEIEQEVAHAVAGRENIIWLNRMLPREEVIQLYTHARLFVCPSVYEPFGLINLEAMACNTAVVATAVGGIKEVVVDGETGFLVPPGNPEALAGAINKLWNNRELAIRMGLAGRRRVEEKFSWDSIAAQTVELYKDLLNGK